MTGRGGGWIPEHLWDAVFRPYEPEPEDLRARFYASQRPATGDGRIVDELPEDVHFAGVIAAPFAASTRELAFLPYAQQEELNELGRHLPANVEVWRVQEDYLDERLLVCYRTPDVSSLPKEPRR